MQPDRPIEIDAIVVDEALSFRLTVQPRCDGLADPVFCVYRKQFRCCFNRAFAVALQQLGAALARQTGLGEAFVGSLFVAITTSLPEIVVSLAAVRIGALDLGIGNVLGSNLFNLLILGLDDVFYRQGPLMADADASHAVSIAAIVMMYALFLIGLTYKVMTKRFVVSWDTGTIAAVYLVAITLSYLLRS